jgi:hypothetical protein
VAQSDLMLSFVVSDWDVLECVGSRQVDNRLYKRGDCFECEGVCEPVDPCTLNIPRGRGDCAFCSFGVGGHADLERSRGRMC